MAARTTLYRSSRAAVRRVTRTHGEIEMKPEKHVDLVIVGGGPAGMTAAVYAAQANLSTVILEESVTGGLVNSTHTVLNFPSYPRIHGMELMEKMREHVDSLSVPVEEICEIEALSLEGKLKTVETDEEIFRSKAVILATGRKPVAIDLPTECDDMHYCAICDGGAYKGKRVLVVGGGNSAFDESLYLLQIGVSHLTIVETESRFFAAESTQQQLLTDDRVTPRTGTKLVDLCLEEGRLAGAVIEDLATGRKPVAIDLPTECDDMHYCAICDGGAYKGKRVLVVGGGNSAFDESLYLLQIGVSHLTIVETESRFFAAESTQQQLLTDDRVTPRTGTKLVDLCLEEGRLAGAVIEDLASGNRETLPMDGVFVFLGQTPNNESFKDQVALSEKGYILAGADMGTNIPGVYGVGDINEKVFRQITTAMGDATVAALSVERYIRNLKGTI